MPVQEQRRLAAIVAADVVGYPPLLKIACLAHMGRLEEAQSALAGIPAESIAQFRRLADRRPPFMRPEDFAYRHEGLRLAGLPE